MPVCTPRGCACQFTSSTLTIFPDSEDANLIHVEQAEFTDITELQADVAALETDFDALVATVAANATAASDALEDAVPAAVTSWTPTFNNLTVGNGTLTGRSYKVNRLVVVEFTMIFGTTTSIAGDVSITNLPYASIQLFVHSSVQFLDSGTATYVGVLQQITPGQAAAIRRLAVSGTNIAIGVLSSTVPHAWANPDSIRGTAVYLTNS